MSQKKDDNSEPHPASSKDGADSAEDAQAVTQLRQLMEALDMRQHPQNTNLWNRKERKESYKFWGSQPVTQFDEVGKSTEAEEGPIDVEKTLDEIKKTPINLPKGYEWSECDVSKDSVASEVNLSHFFSCHHTSVRQVYKLLTFNYVEDDDMMFRFDYSPDFIKWALLPPGYRVDWFVGVRVSSSQRLVGFISAIPANIKINGTAKRMVEINFLCVHKKLRSKRLAPVLIREITRRVNLQNIWQATYTAGALLPTPIASCRYWHRSLNPKKLIEIKFSKLSSRMTMARTIKLLRLPEDPLTPGLRQLVKSDCPQVKDLLNKYLERFGIAPVFSLEDIEHWFVPREGVIDSYVVEGESGKITDLTSFYSLPSSILNDSPYDTLRAAYMYYTVPGTTPLAALVKDALIMAKKTGFDVFNALDILENETFLKDLKFGEGDGYLQYYLYNWRMAKHLAPKDVGLILL